MKLIILLSIDKINELICARLWFSLLSLKNHTTTFVCFVTNHVALLHVYFRQLDVFFKAFSRHKHSHLGQTLKENIKCALLQNISYSKLLLQDNIADFLD